MLVGWSVFGLHPQQLLFLDSGKLLSAHHAIQANWLVAFCGEDAMHSGLSSISPARHVQISLQNVHTPILWCDVFVRPCISRTPIFYTQPKFPTICRACLSCTSALPCRRPSTFHCRNLHQLCKPLESRAESCNQLETWRLLEFGKPWIAAASFVHVQMKHSLIVVLSGLQS